jgi:two-component system nitrogen regulation response regulator NtrX
MPSILLVDDLKAMRDQFAYDIRRKTGFDVLAAANGREALDVLASEEVDVVVLDLEMPEMDGLAMLEIMAKEGPENVPVIVYTAKGDFQRCVRAVQLGAYNFFAKDEVTLEQLARKIENALERRHLIIENRALRQAAQNGSALVGNSAAIIALRASIEKVAGVPSNVLILGESGTGKELVAKEIHRLSPRVKMPFVAVNCAALPENLVESELFGFEKGAFSGALRTTKGKFEAANGGTLFLDEIGDMPLPVQAKLLRVLQENEITRIGGESRVIKVDVRVIAATHRQLEEEIAAGRMRQDLYYHICTHVINVPPLRERLDDIEALTSSFIEKTCRRFRIPPKQAASKTLPVLKTYDWRKNNVRELENIIERMIIQCNGKELLPEHIPADIREKSPLPTPVAEKTFQELRQEAEKQIILNCLESNNWHITNTAKALGIANHSNLLKMMRRLGIQRPERNEHSGS